MAIISTPVPIAPPANRPPRHSLLQVGEDLLNWDGDHTEIDQTEVLKKWEGGVVFNPESCDSGGFFVPACEDPVDAFDTENSTCTDKVTYTPFVVWAYEKGTTADMFVKDFKGLALRKLATTQSFNLAREFWTGAESTTFTLNNPSLHTGATPVSAAVMPLLQGFAELGDRLAVEGASAPGDIHVPRRVLYLLKSAKMVHADFDMATGIISYCDVFGNKVIADAGYTGGDDSNTVDASHSTAWIYATSPVGVAAGPVQYIDDDLSRVVSRGTNDLVVIAYRTVAAVWDQCVHLSAEVEICETCCTGNIVTAGD